MDFEGILMMKVQEKSGTTSSGNEWTRAKFIINLKRGGSFVFDVLGASKIEELDEKVGKNCVLHIGVNAKTYNGNWYTETTYFGGRVVEDDKATTGQANNAPATEVPEAPAAPAPTPEHTPAAEPAPEGPIDDLPF